MLWYKNRLKSMSIPEIGHRIKEQIKRINSRYYYPKYIEYFNVNEDIPKIPYIDAELKILFDNSSLMYEWKQFANSVIKKEHSFLGTKWPSNYTSEIWHIDPISNKEWPKNSYCFGINYRNTKLYGDVKFVWELNRLQYLQPLAILAYLEKNKKISKFCLNQIISWIDNNPPFNGINWVSGIELSCRIISILIVSKPIPPLGPVINIFLFFSMI